MQETLNLPNLVWRSSDIPGTLEGSRANAPACASIIDADTGVPGFKPRAFADSVERPCPMGSPGLLTDFPVSGNMKRPVSMGNVYK